MFTEHVIIILNESDVAVFNRKHSILSINQEHTLRTVCYLPIWCMVQHQESAKQEFKVK